MENGDVPYPFKEFEVGGEKFLLNMSQEACDVRDIAWLGIVGKMNKMSREKENGLTMEDILGLYKMGIDATFGPGAFERFFTLCQRDTAIFMDLIEKLKKEFLNLGGQNHV